MKLAISGKGGVGKTTLAAALAAAIGSAGRGVVAIDADPDANLAAALGLPPDEPITPLAEMRELIEQRTGATKGHGAFFKLNPRVDDIPEKFCRRIGDIRLLVLGGISRGGEGCACPASALLKALLIHLVLGRDEDLIMDMEAGIEHLGRATAQSMDALLVVVDTSPWSTQTALRVRRLAADVGIRNIFAVANRVTESGDVDKISRELDDIPLIAHLPRDDRFAAGVVTIGADGRVTPGEALADNLDTLQQILSEIKTRT